MRRSAFLTSGALLLAAGFATGCAAGTPSVGATPSPNPVPRPSGPLADPESPRRIVYDDQLVSDPLPPSSARTARSAMSAEDAVSVATKQAGIAPDLQPGTPAATLRLVYPGQPSATRKVTGKPTWLLTWRNSAPAVRGPVTLTEEERRAMIASLECVFVVTVDPASRTATRAGQLCERQ